MSNPTDPNFNYEASNTLGLATIGGSATPTFGDLDGDGDLDAFIGNNSGGTVFYRNIGTATAPNFSLESTNPFGLNSVGLFSLTRLVDIDSDGDLDALIGNGVGQIVAFENIGTSTQPSFSRLGSNPFGFLQLDGYPTATLADLDGDGDLDALVGNNDGLVYFFGNIGTATQPSFSLAGSNLFGLTDVGVNAAPALVDIDNDGDYDALIGNQSGDTLVYRNVGTTLAPTFSLVGTTLFGLGGVGVHAVPTFVDIDGDGDLDAFIGAGSGVTILYRGGPPLPATPAGLALAAGTNSGLTADTVTNVASPTITGTADAAATVMLYVLYDGAALLGTAVAGGSGLWTVPRRR